MQKNMMIKIPALIQSRIERGFRDVRRDIDRFSFGSNVSRQAAKFAKFLIFAVFAPLREILFVGQSIASNDKTTKYRCGYLAVSFSWNGRLWSALSLLGDYTYRSRILALTKSRMATVMAMNQTAMPAER